MIDTRRNDRHPHRFFEGGLEGRAQDDVGFVVNLLADAARGLVHVVQRQAVAAGYGYQQAPSTLHRAVVEQRIGDRRFGSSQCAPFPHSFAGPNHRGGARLRWRGWRRAGLQLRRGVNGSSRPSGAVSRRFKETIPQEKPFEWSELAAGLKRCGEA